MCGSNAPRTCVRPKSASGTRSGTGSAHVSSLLQRCPGSLCGARWETWTWTWSGFELRPCSSSGRGSGSGGGLRPDARCLQESHDHAPELQHTHTHTAFIIDINRGPSSTNNVCKIKGSSFSAFTVFSVLVITSKNDFVFRVSMWKIHFCLFSNSFHHKEKRQQSHSKKPNFYISKQTRNSVQC